MAKNQIGPVYTGERELGCHSGIVASAIAKEIECGWSYSENKIIRVVVSYSRAL